MSKEDKKKQGRLKHKTYPYAPFGIVGREKYEVLVPVPLLLLLLLRETQARQTKAKGGGKAKGAAKAKGRGKAKGAAKAKRGEGSQGRVTLQSDRAMTLKG